MKENEPQKTEPTEKPPEPGQKTQLPTPQEQEAVPTTGRRQVLSNVRRQLTDDELTQSGTQKMLLEMLEEAEAHKDDLKNYVASFHEADKRAAILGEKLNADRSIEIFFGVGVGIGGTILGLSQSFWTSNLTHGILCLSIGLVLIVVSCIGRAVKR